MAEPDHIFVNPLPNLANGGHPAGFPFFYIKPAENEKIIRKFFPEENGPVNKVDPIGNSPVIIEKVEYRLLLLHFSIDVIMIDVTFLVKLTKIHTFFLLLKLLNKFGMELHP